MPLPKRLSRILPLLIIILVPAAARLQATAVGPTSTTRPTTAPATRPAARRFDAVDLPLKLDGATAEQAAWLKPYDQKPERFSYTVSVEPVWEDETVASYRVEFPSPFASPWPENNKVPGELFVPRKPPAGKMPAAVVLDILDGSAILARGMALGLARGGVAALYMPMSCYGPRRPAGGAHFIAYRERPELAIAGVRQTVMDVRRAKALLSSRPDVDPDRIAVTGISLGGIVTALAAGVDGTFYRVIPILAGGDLPAIIFYARETRQMRAAFQAHNIDQEAAAKVLADVEPLHFASRIGADRCLMINAAKDEVIPKETTEALNKAIGSPTILWTPAGHYSSIWYLEDIRQRTAEFVNGKKVERLEGKE